MIDAEKAIQNAKIFAKNNITDRSIPNLLVEEIELSENEKYWIITLGWDGRRKPLTALEAAMGFSDVMEREYRVFHVDVKDGMVKKMKLRE